MVFIVSCNKKVCIRYNALTSEIVHKHLRHIRNRRFRRDSTNDFLDVACYRLTQKRCISAGGYSCTVRAKESLLSRIGSVQSEFLYKNPIYVFGTIIGGSAVTCQHNSFIKRKRQSKTTSGYLLSFIVF